jgi:hypothetical protein
VPKLWLTRAHSSAFQLKFESMVQRMLLDVSVGSSTHKVRRFEPPSLSERYCLRGVPFLTLGTSDRSGRAELEASRDYLFRAAGVKTDLFRG